MPIPVIKYLTHDHREITIDGDNPMAVTLVANDNVLSDADLIYITSTTAAAGQTQLVAAPGAGIRIVVSSFMVQNESVTATTVSMQAGGADVFRALLQTQGSDFSGSFWIGREWKLPASAALNLWLSAANSHLYNVTYYTESTG